MLGVDKKQLKAVPGGTTPRARFNSIGKVKADVTLTAYGHKNWQQYQEFDAHLRTETR
jgi:hypothetical protein